MKGKFALRTKITAWFSAALIIIVCITYLVVLTVSDQIIQKTIVDNLVEAVEHNVDEVEYLSSINRDSPSSDVDYYLQYQGGYLEIDDDFLDEANKIYTSLYNGDGTLLYGENPIAKYTGDEEFRNLQIQNIEVKGVKYYIFDRVLTAEGVEGLWLRGIVSEEQGNVQMASISRTSLILLPALLLITIVGGYLIAGRALRPIQKISDTALEISKGNDLKKRIDVGEGKDELHRLADNFNGMFERLDKAFQAERQFTSDASHELRTPMTVILSQCELALETPCDTEEYVEALTVVQRQGQKMSRLINDMLDFTRLEMKTRQYMKESLDLTELVASLCGDMALIRENNIMLEAETQECVQCVGNRELLTRLLSNLIGNAYRYGKENGHILVSLTADKENVQISVKDDGIGIAPEEREKIFARFYQADSSHSGKGTGLGLAMAREIAHFHGGEIFLESELGAGSKFTFTMPKKILTFFDF